MENIGTHLPNHIELFGERYEWFSVLYGVFLLSAMARLAVAAVFLRHLQEMRPVRKPNVSGLIFRIARFHPLSGVIFDIVGAKKSDKPEERDEKK